MRAMIRLLKPCRLLEFQRKASLANINMYDLPRYIFMFSFFMFYIYIFFNFFSIFKFFKFSKHFQFFMFLRFSLFIDFEVFQDFKILPIITSPIQFFIMYTQNYFSSPNTWFSQSDVTILYFA